MVGGTQAAMAPPFPRPGGPPYHAEAMMNRPASQIPSNPGEYACLDLVNSRFADYRGKRPARH
jgi:hypothetical protein